MTLKVVARAHIETAKRWSLSDIKAAALYADELTLDLPWLSAWAHSKRSHRFHQSGQETRSPSF